MRLISVIGMFLAASSASAKVSVNASAKVHSLISEIYTNADGQTDWNYNEADIPSSTDMFACFGATTVQHFPLYINHVPEDARINDLAFCPYMCATQQVVTDANCMNKHVGDCTVGEDGLASGDCDCARSLRSQPSYIRHTHGQTQTFKGCTIENAGTKAAKCAYSDVERCFLYVANA